MTLGPVSRDFIDDYAISACCIVVFSLAFYMTVRVLCELLPHEPFSSPTTSPSPHTQIRAYEYARSRGGTAPVILSSAARRQLLGQVLAGRESG